MIAEFKVELILMLQPPDLQDPTCCMIAPVSGEFKPTPYLNITAKEIVEFEYYTAQKLLLIDNSEKPSREQLVTTLCLTEWKSGRNQPPPPPLARNHVVKKGTTPITKTTILGSIVARNTHNFKLHS
ncbi:uncharacterized protein [Anoplolepis gracilipes]|uniref:uncharacterized protein n=1 Tax=Anoplolepis gracilipes TaxID=354296 RepID=UPI003BA3C568